MDNILDPIVSSDTRNQEDMSYLFGRDPSILAYGQRPCVSKDTKKNLLSVYEIEEYDNTEETGSINSGSQNIQTVKVYLRMKPFPKKLKVTQEQQDAYKVIDASTLYTRLPTLENNTSCLKRSNSTDIVCRKFTFTQTFGPQTTQLELFDQAVKQQMIDFLGGQNSTIMTYGKGNNLYFTQSLSLLMNFISDNNFDRYNEFWEILYVARNYDIARDSTKMFRVCIFYYYTKVYPVV